MSCIIINNIGQNLLPTSTIIFPILSVNPFKHIQYKPKLRTHPH
jgi:hypothetical protein